MHVVIVGNGISGVTAARYIRKLSDHRITLISAESRYFFSRTALMYLYMGQMTMDDITPYPPSFWKKNRIDIRQARILDVSPETKQVHCDDGSSLTYDKLILATGSTSRMPSIEGLHLAGVQGLYSVQDIERLEQFTPKIESAVIVGGGLVGVELAEMLHSRKIPVTIFVREAHYYGNVLPKEESVLVQNVLQNAGIDVRTNTEIAGINGQNHVTSVTTQTGEEIPCSYVGMAIGVEPQITPWKDIVETDNGILVDNYLHTSIPDIYAVGDCTQLREPGAGRKPTEPVWYTARMMGEVVAYNVCGKPTQYDPGIWFNSAKFFHLEYQVYGDIKPDIPEGISTLFWAHPEGTKSIRIQYNTVAGNVTGFNLMGIRYRQEVCEKWIRDKTPITAVLQDLSLANFDPEFSRQYEAEILATYNAQHGSKITLQKDRNLNAVLDFLK